jgi:hypothetical protein
MKRLTPLAALTALLLGAGPPTIQGPSPGFTIAGRSSTSHGSNITSVTASCSPSSDTAPFSCLATVTVTHSGRFGAAIYELDCDNGAPAPDDTSPISLGNPVTALSKTYTFDGPCNINAAGTYDVAVRVLASDGVTVLGGDDTTVTAVAPGDPEIQSASATHSTLLIPFDPTIAAAVLGGTGTVTYDIDCNGDLDYADAGVDVTGAGTGATLSSTGCPNVTTAGVKTYGIRATDTTPTVVETVVQLTAVKPSFTVLMSPNDSMGTAPHTTGYTFTGSGNCPTLLTGAGWGCTLLCDALGAACPDVDNCHEFTGHTDATYDTDVDGTFECVYPAGLTSAFATCTCGSAANQFPFYSIEVGGDTSFTLSMAADDQSGPEPHTTGFRVTPGGTATLAITDLALDCNNDGDFDDPGECIDGFTGAAPDSPFDLISDVTWPCPGDSNDTPGQCYYESDTGSPFTAVLTGEREGVTANSGGTTVAVQNFVPAAIVAVQPVALTFQPVLEDQTPPALQFCIDNLTGAQGSTATWTITETPAVSSIAPSSTSGTTTTEDDCITLTPNTTGLTAGTTVITQYKVINSANTTNAPTVDVQLQIQDPIITGFPVWTNGRDAAGNLLVYTGKIGASPTVAVKPNFDNRKGTTSSRFFNSEDTPSTAADVHVVRNSQFLGSVIPVGSGSNPDIANVTWQANRIAKSWLFKQLTMAGARFAFTGPHSDILQTFGLPGCHYLFESMVIQNVAAGQSDSGQIFWNSTMCNDTNGQFKFYVLHDVDVSITAGDISACETRRSAACGGSSCTFNCDGRRILIPFNTGSGPNTARWIINVTNSTPGSPAPTYEGGDASTTPDTPSDGPLIMIPPPGVSCTTELAKITSSLLAPGERFCYANIEAALAAGHTEPPWIRLACGGWANTAANAPNCTSGSGYVASTQ